ncbi:MAG: MogA/MoaB family molybdenum cofactor biosynthesis protein [Bacilli bacterium]
MYKVAIITLSDRAYNQEYADESGPIIKDIVMMNDYQVVESLIIPDDYDRLLYELERITPLVDLIITTGGTGLTPRDITVDAVEDFLDYEVRGMSIALHQFNLSKATGAMFSRALCAVKAHTLIMTLPGSKRAVKEIMEYFIPHLDHGLDHLLNITRH